MSEENHETNILQKVVFVDGELKSLIVEYVGEKLNPENNEVNLEMVISTIAEEFPEVLLAIAEENFLKGYELGLNDISALRMGSWKCII